MKSTDRFNTGTVLRDLLFILLMGFAMLFGYTYPWINPITKENDIKSKAEFIIVLDWEGTLDVDVDLWVQDPLGNTVHFRRSDIGLVHLDRDDLGLSNDTVLLQGEEVVAVINREVTSIRGYIPGEWVINTHWFSNTVGFVGNLPVKVELIRVNPYEVVYTREFEMQHLREEKTAFRFTMGASGWCRDYNETMISIIKGVPIDHPAGPSPAMKRQMEENMNSGEE